MKKLLFILGIWLITTAPQAFSQVLTDGQLTDTINFRFPEKSSTATPNSKINRILKQFIPWVNSKGGGGGSLLNDVISFGTIERSGDNITCEDVVVRFGSVTYGPLDFSIPLDPPADDSTARIDRIVVNSDSSVSIITGTPSISPIAPGWDKSTQVSLGVVHHHMGGGTGSGSVTFATQAEVDAGVNTNKAVNSVTLNSLFDRKLDEAFAGITQDTNFIRPTGAVGLTGNYTYNQASYLNIGTGSVYSQLGNTYIQFNSQTANRRGVVSHSSMFIEGPSPDYSSTSIFYDRIQHKQTASLFTNLLFVPPTALNRNLYFPDQSDTLATLSDIRSAVDTISSGGGGVGVTDGNKGDITVSGSGANWQINANAVGPTEIASGSVGDGHITSVAASKVSGLATVATSGAYGDLSGRPTISGTNTGDNATNTTSNAYADGKVADAINDGTTTIAASQNAVFDGLALKANTSALATVATTGAYNDLSGRPTISGTNTGDETTSRINALYGYTPANNTTVVANTASIATNTASIATNTAKLNYIAGPGNAGNLADIPTQTQLFGFGDSFTRGATASVPAKSYVSTISEALGTLANNQGNDGDGVFGCFKKVVQAEAASGNTFSATLMIGFNDIRRDNSAKGLEGVKGGHRAIFANHFLKTAVAANNAGVTTSGTWTTISAGTYNDKASLSLSGLGRQSSVSGSTLTYSFTGSNIVIGTWGCDNVAFTDGGFSVTVDGIAVGSWSPSNKASAIHGRTQNAFIAFGLGGSTHTLVITTTSNNPTLIDYIGTLNVPSLCPAMLVGGLCKQTTAGYATVIGTYPLSNDANFDAADAVIKEAIGEFPGYPLYYVNTNKYLVPATDILTTDNIHPNDLGMGHIAQGFVETVRQTPTLGILSVRSHIGPSIVRATNDVGTTTQLVTYLSTQGTSGFIGASSGLLSSTSTNLHLGSSVGSSSVGLFAGGFTSNDEKVVFNSAGNGIQSSNPGNTSLFYQVKNVNTGSTATAYVIAQADSPLGFGALRAVNNSGSVTQISQYGNNITTAGFIQANDGLLTSSSPTAFHIGNQSTGPVNFFTGGTSAFSNIRGNISTTGTWRIGSNTTATERLDVEGNVWLTTAGNKLKIKAGTNASVGTATLSAGTVTISTTAVAANSIIFLTVQTLGTVTAPKTLAVTTKTAGTSFVITSEDNTDTSTVAWWIVDAN